VDVDYRPSDRGGWALVQIIDPRDGSVKVWTEMINYDGRGIMDWLDGYKFYFV
jgi:hypothetical protein